MIKILILVAFYLSLRNLLCSYVKKNVLLPDGRHWTIQNLNIPLLGYKCPVATKEEGRLYTFKHVQIINALFRFFAVGWHVPTDEEWTALIDVIGNGACIKLKSSIGWREGENGTDDFGFGAIPAGERYYNGETFSDRHHNVLYWSSSICSNDHAYFRYFFCRSSEVARLNCNKLNFLSVRCIKN